MVLAKAPATHEQSEEKAKYVRTIHEGSLRLRTGTHESEIQRHKARKNSEDLKRYKTKVADSME